MRLVICIFWFTLSSLLLPNLLYAESNTNEKGLNKLRNHIENLQKNLAIKEKSRLGLTSDLQKSKQEIDKINQKLINLNVERYKVKDTHLTNYKKN